MKYILAIDGGGTKTDFVLIDETANLLARLQLGPSNYQNVGEASAQSVLEKGVTSLLQAASLTLGDITTACLGLAGLDTDEDERIYTKMVERIFGNQSTAIQLENDCFIALHSGTLGEPGIALIAGTGSMAIASNEKGQRARSGGWGYRFGDEGSGYYIGYEAIARSVKARDGRAPETVLADRIEETLGANLFELVTRYNAEDPGPDHIASIAPLVSQAAEEGDAVARQILDDAASELVLAAKAITRQLAFERHPLRFVFAGGAFNAARLTKTLSDQLQALYGDVQCIRPELPPVAGACILGLQKTGIKLTEAIRNNLVASFG